MTRTDPFVPPATLEPDLARAEAVWRGLLRGSATVPFADDLRLAALGDLEPRVALLEVFALPERFRFAHVGAELQQPQPGTLAGRFADEVRLRPPLDLLRAQASATVELAAPTRIAGGDGDRPYVRLLLPFWGDGRTDTLLAVVAPRRA